MYRFRRSVASKTDKVSEGSRISGIRPGNLSFH